MNFKITLSGDEKRFMVFYFIIEMLLMNYYYSEKALYARTLETLLTMVIFTFVVYRIIIPFYNYVLEYLRPKVHVMMESIRKHI